MDFKISESVILKNCIQCTACQDIIESKYRWNFVSCKCNTCSVDGGRDYLKRSGENYIELSICSDDIRIIRKYFTWKSYGKNAEFPKGIDILLEVMQDEHIKAILDTQWHVKGSTTEEILNKELEYRKFNKRKES